MPEPSIIETLWELIRKQHPGAQLVPEENGFALVTIHSLGVSEEEALQQAVTDYRTMETDALELDTLIDEVMENLSTRGMSRERRDNIIAICEQCDIALAAGIMIGLIQPLRVPYYTRTIEDLKRRTETRLMMIAQEMKEQEKAHKRASMTFTHTPSGTQPKLVKLEQQEGEGIIAFRRRQYGIA